MNEIKVVKKNSFSEFQWLIFYSLLLMAVKLLLLPFVQANNSDGVCRVFTSLSVAENFSLIRTGNWSPLFFYLMGGALKIYHNAFFTPLAVNILLSVFMLFPLYFLLKRMFNDYTALLLCIIFSLSPIVFRLSLLAMAETPSLFFIILGASVTAKGLMEKQKKYVILGGLFFSLAGGFRYESWFMAPLAAIVIAFRFSIKEALMFLLPAIVFPLYWLLSNYIYSGNLFASFTWAADAPKTNSIDSFDSFLRRTWWLPLSMVFAFGPVAFYFFIREIIRLWKNRSTQKTAFYFLMLFGVVYLIFAINCYRGSLLMQHRFTVTLYLLSFPFLGFYFKNEVKNAFKMALLFSVFAFFPAFFYSSRGAEPIPRLRNKEAAVLAEIISQNKSPNSGLIVDFYDWETTYYVAFMSGLPKSNIVIIDQSSSGDLIISEIEYLLDKHPKGFLLYYAKGILLQVAYISGDTLNFNRLNKTLNISILYENDGVGLYGYRVW